ncbi:intercellular trafficking and secretion [Elasticomyces elasticus]|nr:intercellular trafficking and secretion [Elasticomyces elasticus]
MDTHDDFNSVDFPQAGRNADAQDLAGPGPAGRIVCTVTRPQKENEGTQTQFISYLVTTETDFKSFQNPHTSVRRRFTDFVFLYKTLSKEYPQCAVPPLPDKHKMEYVRGDRFGPDFTLRRAFSLQRFLKRLTLHPVLRRSVLLALFLESSDWNSTMHNRRLLGTSMSENGGGGIVETLTDNFLLNAFTKTHKVDQRFIDVKDRAHKLDNDLLSVSKTVTRVARRESDLESDYSDLATQFQKLAQLEPGVQGTLTSFSSSLETTDQGMKTLKEHTDQNYLGSLKDMEHYISSLKSLLKTREQKQLDFEGLTEYLQKASAERDNLASGGSMGASGFIRHKIDDVRGIDHESVRREKIRKLEAQIRRLNDEVDSAKKTSEAFDEEVMREVLDFERIKAVEFRDSLGGLAQASVDFFRGNIETWEKFVEEMEREELG